MTSHILVVEDEINIRIFLEDLLRGEGYRVTAVASGESALQHIVLHRFDLALLDLKLEGISGIEVLRVLHEKSPETTVIILTAHGSLETAVHALRLGAHDYLFKPCEADELRQSVRRGLQKQIQEQQQKQNLWLLEQALNTTLNNLRAAVGVIPPQTPSPTEPVADKPSVLQHGAIQVDLARHTVTFNGRLLKLTPIQFDLLAHLVAQAPRVVSTQELVTHLYTHGTLLAEDSDVIRTHVYRIRQTIKEAGGDAEFIRTIRGIGFALQE